MNRRSRLNNWLKSVPNYWLQFGVLVFLISSVLSYFLIKQAIKTTADQQGKLESQIARNIEKNAEIVLRNSYIAMLRLANTIDENGQPTNFVKTSEQIISDFPEIDVLELVPKGVIKYIYPLKGNEQALNYDILKDSKVNEEAKKAIEKDVYFAGPISLKQGGRAIIGRAPITRRDTFWGFSAVLIQTESLFEALGFNNVDTNQFYLQLSKINASGVEEFFLPKTINFSENECETIYISDGDWKIYIRSKKSSLDIYLLAVWILIALVISVGLSALLAGVLFKSKKEIDQLYNQLNVYLDNSPLGIVEYDQDLFITKWSEHCEKIFGYTQQEVFSKKMNALDLVYPGDEPKVEHVIEDIFQGNSNGNVSRNRNKGKDGSVVHCLWFNSVYRNKSGGVQSVFSLVQDVTDTTLKEIELEQSRRDVNTILGATNDLMVLLNVSDGKFIYAAINTAFEKLIDDNIENVKGKQLGELIKRKNIHEIHKAINTALITGKTQLLEEEVSFKGKDFWLETTVTPSFNTSENLNQLLIVARDVTERHKAQLELKRNLDLTKSQNDRLLNFAYIVSHNLRTHSSNISGILTLLKDEKDQEKVNVLLNHLTTVSSALDETMDHLNEVVNIQTNNDIKLKSLSLNDFILKTIILLREKVEAADATINNLVDDSILVKFSSSYLESVILNFLSNALKYSSLERKSIITLRAKKESGFVVLQIQDNGVGIDMEKYGDQLFGLYKRFHKTQEGKGLGLFITKNQVEALGGKVEVKSRLNVGTTFSVYFPEGD
ncbi:MAG: PAS domain S-box protein [Bacteroidia bacterium]